MKTYSVKFTEVQLCAAYTALHNDLQRLYAAMEDTPARCDIERVLLSAIRAIEQSVKRDGKTIDSV